MTIVGRLTKDAEVNTLKDDRKVVNFSVAVNDTFKSKKEGERVKLTSYFNCSYWIGEGIAEHLKKGTLVQVEGRVFASAYVGTDGTAKASLNCHVNSIKMLTGKKETENNAAPQNSSEDTHEETPF